MAREGAKSRRRITGLRSKTTKARTHVNRLRAANADLKKKLAEALEQEAATSEILRVISAALADIQSVLDVIVRNAARLCEAEYVDLLLRDGDVLKLAASHGSLPTAAETRPIRRTLVTGRVIMDGRPLHISDLQAELDEFPDVPRRPGITIRTLLCVPLMREDVAIGALQIRRTEVRPFTDKQISLVQTFATQAVIAIENTRLLNELRQRTDDLSEALEQQTATSEVLQVISRSPGELQPVFESMLANATRLCGAKFGTLNLYDGDVFRNAAVYNVPSAFAAMQDVPFRPHPRSGHAEVVRTKRAVQFEDARALQSYREGDPRVAASVDLGGARTFFVVPMLKENRLIGTISMWRTEVRAFSAKEIALVETFADQAVIAIENTRLLNDLRQRTTDLTEALEQQTATSEVLRVISSSPGALEPVFQTILADAMRLCEANFGFIFRYKDETWEMMAHEGAVPEYAEIGKRLSVRPGPQTMLARISRTKEMVQVYDLAATRGYTERDPLVVLAVETGGVRTFLGVPCRPSALVGQNELIA